jgi:biopolymer transport protein TolR
MARHIKRKRFMSEINVVPYIDVMLVLLIIFMITAPLLTQGIDVNLPRVASEAVQPGDNEPVVVSIDRAGNIYIDYGDDQDKPIAAEDLVNRVSALLRHQPGIPIYIKGDTDVPYGRVVLAMSLLQRAGVPNVGMLTEPPETEN